MRGRATAADPSTMQRAPCRGSPRLVFQARALLRDSDWAEASTCAEAEPVSPAPRFTSLMLDATSEVPFAAWCTLWAMSCVAAPCCSTAAAMVPVISEMRLMVAPISLMASTELLGRGLHAADLGADLLGRLGGLGGERS